MVAMSVLFGAVVVLMVVLGVLAERRHQAPFTELGAQELQEFTRPAHEAPTPSGLTDVRPTEVTSGELAGVFQPA